MYPGKSRFNQKEPQYLVRAAISSDALSKYMSDFSDIRQKSIALFQQNRYRVYGKVNQLSNETFDQLLSSLKLDSNAKSSQTATVSLEGGTYYIVAHYLPLIDSTLVQAVPVTEIYAQQTVYRSYLNYFILLSVLLFVVYAVMTHKLVKKPVGKLIVGFREIERGNYDVSINLRNPANEFRDLIIGFNRMTSRLNEAVNKLYIQELYVKQIELKQLQMQINPHFLYNSYFMLSRLVAQEDLENAKRLAEHLGEFFRYITRNDQDKMPLSSEWGHAKSYIDIQAIRYAQRIVFEIAEVPSAYNGYFVPRLILQPIVENALEHGFKRKTEQGLLQLYFVEYPTYLSIFVEDNGDDITVVQVEELHQRLAMRSDVQNDTTALVNIHRRLQLCFGVESGLFLSFVPDGGLRVELRLPITNRGE
jgi:two-component system sensor histidine kinase YesM